MALHLASKMNFAHIGAGDLLRQEMATNGPHSNLIDQCIRESKIVPSHITTELLLRSLKAAYPKTNLAIIDGFPRNEQNFASFCDDILPHVHFGGLIWVMASVENMLSRLNSRKAAATNGGRTDDNVETFWKRIQTFENETMPVIEQFSKIGRVIKIDGNKSVKDVTLEGETKLREALKADGLELSRQP